MNFTLRVVVPFNDRTFFWNLNYLNKTYFICECYLILLFVTRADDGLTAILRQQFLW